MPRTRKQILQDVLPSGVGILALGLLAIGFGCADDSASMRTVGADKSDDYGGWDADADGDGDADWNGDEPGDGSDTDNLPPEVETSADYQVPQGVGRYVFIADETHDAVVIVDSESLAIRVVEVGSRPTQVVGVPGRANPTVAVMNLDSDDVTLLTVPETGDPRFEDLEVRPDVNAMAVSPDGAFIVAYHDPRFTADSGAPSTDQEITVLSTKPGALASTHLTVGLHPWKVTFDESSRRAFVISEEGISIVDLSALDSIDRPDQVTPFEAGSYDSITADIEVTPDGTTALARKHGDPTLVVAPLDGKSSIRRYDLPAVPTDLDLAADGSFGVLVLRELEAVALFDIPLPKDLEADPFTYLDLGDRLAGIATLGDDPDRILLHTTTGLTAEDPRRLTLLQRDKRAWTVRSTVLERDIVSVAAGVDSAVAVAIHSTPAGSGTEQPYAYTLVALPDLQTKFQQIPTEPGQLLLTPDGDMGYLLLEEARRTEVIDLTSFIVDQLTHGSPPMAAGFAAATDKVFIAQDHPTGRMTFVGVHDGSVKTVTGYNLNDDIDY